MILVVLSLGISYVLPQSKLQEIKLHRIFWKNVRIQKKMYIGEQTADEIKRRIANALVVKEPETITISGRDVETGLPHSIDINSNEVESYIRSSLQEIVRCHEDDSGVRYHRSWQRILFSMGLS